MSTREEKKVLRERIVMLEQHLVSELEPALAGRVKKLFKALDKLMDGCQVKDNPKLVIGWRAQNYFLLPEVELIEEGMANIYRYARPKSLNMVLKLLETRDLTVSIHSNKRRGSVPVWRQLHTSKGRIVF